ncbi:hypothetical protein T440DRAFT_423536, partial [Plenodomus tracheiphilus IPT5]
MNAMVEVIRILSGLRTANEIITDFGLQTNKWRCVSDRLFDVKEAMDAAEITLESWRRKFDIQERRPIIYMQVLFGKQGCERIQATLESINVVTEAIRSDINNTIGQALKVRRIKMQHGDLYSAPDMGLVADCVRRIQEKSSWSRKFVLSMLGRMEDLEIRIDKLHRKVIVLERISDYFLQKEHPDIFSDIRRVPGRRTILRIGEDGMDTVQNKLLDALAARKDAELLHRATRTGNQIHIGLAVPQIHKRDFAFLVNLNGRAHDTLVRPVTIRSINDPARLQTDLPAAVSNLIGKTHATCYLLPPSSTSAGFEVKTPPTNLLCNLEHKQPLSTIIRHQNRLLGSQILYPRDQSALASGISQASFRLIGSPWLNFLDCTNIRWRRSTAGSYTSMLTAKLGDLSLTRSLQKCLISNLERRDSRDLTKHAQIFRIGLVLAEVVLKAPVSYVEYDAASNSMKIYVGDGEEVDATEVAAEVERTGNVFLGNMVFFCLSALQDRDVMAGRGVEGMYFREVVKDAELLDGLVRRGDRKKGVSPVGSRGGSGVNTPRSAG